MFESDCSVQDVFLCTPTQPVVNDVHSVEFAKHSNVDNEWSVCMNVKGTPTNLEIDTGARCNILSLKTVRAVNAENEITASDIYISAVHGHPVQALGQVMLPCTYNGQTHNVVFQVLSTSKKADILGRYDCSTYGLLQRVHTLQCVRRVHHC